MLVAWIVDMNCGHECMRLTNDHDRLTGVVSLVQVKATKSPTVQLLTDSGSSCKHTHTHTDIYCTHTLLCPRPVSGSWFWPSFRDRDRFLALELRHNTVLYCTVLRRTVHYCCKSTVQDYYVQYSAVQCSTVHCNAFGAVNALLSPRP